MKTLTTILILLFIFFITFFILAKNTLSDNKLNQDKIDPGSTNLEEPPDSYMGTEEEDSFYDQDTFLRKLDRMKLPPLTEKEKIIWSFRLAETNPFL